MVEQKKISLRVLDGQTEFAEDELQKLGDFVNKLSKPLFYLALIGAAFFFGNRFYQDAQLQKQKSGAEQLEIVQDSFDELTKAIATAKKSSGEEKVKNDKVVFELETKFKEQVKTLGDRPEPYKHMSAVYTEVQSKLLASADGTQPAVSNVTQSVIDYLSH